MKYTGNICPGCEVAFKDDDDVVVCPECGTPQHRHCYEKENRCVVSDRHESSYMWQAKEKPHVESQAHTAEKEEYFPCPNCNHENPKGSVQCESCGMKFVVFGMNVVDALNEKEKKESANATTKIPDYKAPFTLGVGEGFENAEAEAEAQKIAEEIVHAFQGADKSDDGTLNFPGPFPQTDKIDGVKTNTVGNFIGIGGMNYITKFKKLESGKKISFNFAAFFFAPYWFFYRKLYKPGVFFMTAFLALSIIFTPAMLEYTELIYSSLPQTEEALMAMTEAELSEIFNMLYDKMIPIAIFIGITLGLRIIAGFMANTAYKKYVLTNAAQAEKMTDRNGAMLFMAKLGGASIAFAAMSFFAQQLISMAVSYFF